MFDGYNERVCPTDCARGSSSIPFPGTDKFIFLADHPGLDFVNTRIVNRFGRVELLETPRDLLVWMFAAYLITGQDFAFAERNWLKQPVMTQALADALLLRQALEECVIAWMGEGSEREPPVHALHG